MCGDLAAWLWARSMGLNGMTVIYAYPPFTVALTDIVTTVLFAGVALFFSSFFLSGGKPIVHLIKKEKEKENKKE